jgi:hypothetical protein
MPTKSAQGLLRDVLKLDGRAAPVPRTPGLRPDATCKHVLPQGFSLFVMHQALWPDQGAIKNTRKCLSLYHRVLGCCNSASLQQRIRLASQRLSGVLGSSAGRCIAHWVRSSAGWLREQHAMPWGASLLQQGGVHNGTHPAGVTRALDPAQPAAIEGLGHAAGSPLSATTGPAFAGATRPCSRELLCCWPGPLQHEYQLCRRDLA